MVESLYNFLEGMIGPDLVKKTFWFFATIFIFILFLNWFGLIPGCRHDRLGTSDSERRIQRDDAVAAGCECGSESDLRDGLHVFRLLDDLGGAIERRRRSHHASVRSER